MNQKLTWTVYGEGKIKYGAEWVIFLNPLGAIAHNHIALALWPTENKKCKLCQKEIPKQILNVASLMLMQDM